MNEHTFQNERQWRCRHLKKIYTYRFVLSWQLAGWECAIASTSLLNAPSSLSSLTFMHTACTYSYMNIYSYLHWAAPNANPISARNMCVIAYINTHTINNIADGVPAVSLYQRTASVPVYIKCGNVDLCSSVCVCVSGLPLIEVFLSLWLASSISSFLPVSVLLLTLCRHHHGWLSVMMHSSPPTRIYCKNVCSEANCISIA